MQFPDTDFFIVKYEVDLKATAFRIYGDDIKDNGMIPYYVCNGPNKYDNIMENGLLAINKKTYKILFLSGYAFLDDVKKYYFKEISLLNKSMKEYVKVKYFNYNPFEINIVDNKVFFYSEVINFKYGYSTKKLKQFEVSFEINEKYESGIKEVLKEIIEE